ncbi:hypothetical protein EYF80_047160 [Liparis tanakae]|uniref:Uncharacterized protein n=1 Tax=Liparis tanakae TaxID=230148 RepID=A0A4Z2FPF3_9TELE|nr:hypothetical protein EYF80_047160 [Liparis tanakae]
MERETLRDSVIAACGVRAAGLDGHPSDGRLVRIAIGHQLLQLQGPPANEAERRAHGAGAIHVTFPQRSQGVGVVEGDATLLKVKAQAEPGGQRVGEAGGGGGAGAVGDGVPGPVPVAAAVVVVAVLGQVDLTHPHREEAERRSGVQSILRPAVMAAVRIILSKPFLLTQSPDLPPPDLPHPDLSLTLTFLTMTFLTLTFLTLTFLPLTFLTLTFLT